MGESFRNSYREGNNNSCGFLVPSYFKKKRLGGVWAGDKPLDSISLCFYGDSTGIRMWNNPNDPMPIKIANGKTLERCVFYRGGGITVYTDNSVTVKSYPGFYDYYLANERKMSEVMILPVEGEEVVKDEEYYKKLINGLAVDYNKQVENAPNLYKNAMVLQDINTPAPIEFACTVFVDGQIWIGEGYSVGTADRPPCPVNVPSGKLTFETPATSETYSFIMKGLKWDKSEDLSVLRTYQCANYGVGYERAHSTNAPFPPNMSGDIAVSNTYITWLNQKVFVVNDKGINTGSIRFTGETNIRKEFPTSISKILFYKANLTETELKAELAKDIKLR